MLFTVHKTIKNTYSFTTVFRNKGHLIIYLLIFYLVLHNMFMMISCYIIIIFVS